MENKFKLKKFLATASAFAMITGASSAAMGAQFKTNNVGVASIEDGQPVVNAVTHPGGLGGSWAANDSFFFAHAQDLTINAGGNGGTVATIDINNIAGRTITIAKNSSIASIVNSTGVQTAALIVNDGKTLTLGGNAGLVAGGGAQAAGVFTGLGNITLGSGGGGSVLTFNTNATLAGTINSDANDDGIINVNAGKTVTFNGIIGAVQPIAELNAVGDGSTINLGAAATVTAVKVAHANAQVNINGGNLTGDVSFTADGTVNVADTRTITGKVDATVANNGVLNFAGISVVTAKVGQTQALKEVNINGTTGLGVVAFGDEVKTQKFTVNHAGAKVTLAEDLTATNGLQFSADGQVTVAAGGKTITGNVKNTVAAGGDGSYANTGKLIFTAGTGAGNGDGTVTGTIGEEGKALKLVQVVGAGDVDLSGNAHYSESFKFNDADARLLVANNGSLVGNLVANADGDGKVQFAGTGAITGTIGDAGGHGIGLIEANGAGIVTVGAGNHKAAFAAATNAAAGFKFADGANVTGTIDNTTGAVNNTTLKFEGSSVVTGVIGANGGNAFKTIDITGGADKTVEFKAATVATDLNIGKAAQEGAATVKIGNDLTANVSFLDSVSKGGELVIYDGAAHAITGHINKTIGDEARGKVTIAADVGANAVTFTGQIGDTTNNKAVSHLHILNTDAAGSVVLTGGDVHIRKIQAAGAGNLKLSEAGANYKFGEIVLDADNAFSLSVHQNAVLKAPTEGVVNFGSLENGGKRFSELKFTADRTLTIENGINIYADKLNETGVNNNGTLIFTGTSTFSAKSDTQDIKAIEVQGDGHTVTLLQDIKTRNDITLSNNATLAVAGNVTTDGVVAGGGHGIIGAGVGQGKLKFINSAAATVTGKVGEVLLQSIEFNGGNVEFANDVTHTGKDFIFSGTNASQVKFNAAGYGNANYINNSEAGVTHTIVVNTDENLTGNIGIDNPDTKQFNFDLGTNNKTITVTGGAQANGANFINGNVADGKGTLTLNQADVTVNSAGTSAKNLLALTFVENATIKKGAHAVTTTINQGKTATLGGEVSGNVFSLANVGSTANFLDGVKLNVGITAGNAGDGVVEFQGGGSIEEGKNIGGIKTVTFSDIAGKVLTVNANIDAAQNIDIRKGRFKTGNTSITLDAPDVNAVNASFDLASGQDIEVSGGNLTFSGTEGKIAVVVKESGNQLGSGQIIAANGATLKYDNGAKVTVTPDDSNGNRPAGGASRTFTLIANNSGNAAVGTLLVDIDQSKNPFTKWTSKTENGSLILTQTDGANDKIIEVLGSSTDASTKSNFEKLTKALPGTDGSNVVNIVAGILKDEKLSNAQKTEKTQELNDRLTPVSTATDSIETTMSNASSSIGTRIISVAQPTIGTSVQSRSVASEKVSGISAGDDHTRYGAWFSPFFSKTTQKARKGAAGYRDTTYGGSFGMDTKANDDLMIGGALSFANSEMKHRDFKSGDKTKVNSLMFSIYGLQNITDTWFAQGSFSIASNEVKNSERKVAGATAYETTNGKYNSMSFAGDVLFGYNYAVENFNLTPMGGLRYTRVNSAGYKMSGSDTGQNANISQKASNKLEVVVGARASGGTFDVNGMSITPEVHGFINHDLIGKNPKQDIRIGGVSDSLDAKSRKPIRTSYNLGLGVNANYGMMEYGAGYDLHLADKRVGHEGSLKVRVNF